MVNNDEEYIRESRKILPALIKTFLKQIASGVPFFAISLPIQLFEKKSFNQKIAYFNSLAPVFFNKAAALTDKKEQFKLVITNMIATSSLFMTGTGKKPFNPILGETFQGHYSGDPIYIEQVSHHPPISYLSIYGNKYKAHFQFIPKPKVELNSLELRNLST